MAFPSKPQCSVLERFLRSVEKLTGLEVCIYDLVYFSADDERLSLPSMRREHCSSFCMKIKSNHAAWERCRKDEYYRASEAQKLNEPFLHTCHAGLTDLIVPIRQGRRQIGAVYLGQCRTVDRQKTERIIKALAEKYGFCKDELRAEIKSRPSRTSKALRSLEGLISGTRDYIELAESTAKNRQDEAKGCKNYDKTPMENLPIFYLDRLPAHTPPIRQAIEIVRSSYWKNITQTQVAQKVGLSTSHFTREFQKQTGCSFRRCLVLTRVSAAYLLLKRSSCTLAEISDKLGYENVSSLGRAFRTHVGAGPRELLRIQAPPWLQGD